MVYTAAEYKGIIKKTLYNKNYAGVVEESVNHWNADIVGVTWKHEVIEYEIKVALSDLKGEVKAIKRALQGSIYVNKQTMPGYSSYNHVMVAEKVSLTKLEKHYCYLVDNKRQMYSFVGFEDRLAEEKAVSCFVPHKFYFAVPDSMVDDAKVLLKDVPFYGIMNSDNGKIEKPGKLLPRRNVRTSDAFDLFTRACTEWRQEINIRKYYERHYYDGDRIAVNRIRY